MHYDKELDFLLHFFENHKINTYLYQKNTDLSFLDFHIREILGAMEDYTRIKEFLSLYIQPQTIYKINDQFSCIYFIIPLPDENQMTSLIIGPYIQNTFDKEYMIQQIENYKLTPQIFQTLQKQFAKIPILLDDTSILTILQTFGEILWNEKNNFQFQILDQNLKKNSYTHYPTEYSNEVLSHFNVHIYDSYLTQETALIQAVSHGNVQLAEETLSTLFTISTLGDSHGSLRSMKNYAISLNSILSKTAQLTTLNSYEHIHISARFFQKIELCASPQSCMALLREMIRKYCLLIKNHTMKEYSPLIQQAIKQINVDLSADLSLHTMAQTLNSNASYLSTQFKKITGSNYTEYVQKKRIEYAIFLLNTTSLQVQTIAQYCGIPDLNYFSKLFKKYVHYSPSNYRKEISKHKI